MKISKIIFISGLLPSLFGPVAAHAQEAAPADKPVVGRVFNVLHPNTTGQVIISTNGVLAPQDQGDKHDRRQTEADEWIKKGKAQMKQKRVDEAIDAFNHALAMTPYASDPYLPLIDAYTAKGDLQSLAKTYRALLYPAPEKNWSSIESSDPVVLMRFALVLNQIGQKDEALTVYRQGLYHLNYADYKLDTSQYPVMLTTNFDGSNDENVYTPARFEAAARTAIAMKQWQSSGEESQNAAKEQLTKAIAVQPRFGLAYVYRALVMKNQLRHTDPAVTVEQVNEAFDVAEQRVHGASAKAAIKSARILR